MSNFAVGDEYRVNLNLQVDYPLQGDVVFQLATQEGPLTIVPVGLSIRQVYPSLRVEPSSLNAKQLQGSSKEFKFALINDGQVAATNVHLKLPDTSLFSLFSFGGSTVKAAKAGSTLGPGENTTFTLQVRAQQSAGAFIPYQFFLMLPYIMSIIAMIVMARKTKYPQALLVPFRRGERV